MSTFAELNRTVQQTLLGGRLGRPVYVRCLFHSTGTDAAVARLATVTEAVRGWLGQRIVRMYALGSSSGGQLSVTLEFSAGATASIGWSQGAARGEGIDLMVLGNRGALYHDAGSSELWDDPAEIIPSPDIRLAEAIARALRSGKPETVGETLP